MHVPTYEDYAAHDSQEERDEQFEETQETAQSTEGTSETETETETETGTDITPSSHQTFNPDGTSSEVSFMRAAISSTPATMSRHRNMHAEAFSDEQSDSGPSWSASLESPIRRLDREIQSLNSDDQYSMDPQSAQYDDSAEETQRQIPPPVIDDPRSVQRTVHKGKTRAKEPPTPLLHNILLRNASSSIDGPLNSRNISPLKLKSRTPNLKMLNPYLPPDTKPSDWKGVVNLSDPSSPHRRQPSPYKRPIPITPKNDDSFDDSFDLTPPIPIDFKSIPKLGQTPYKEAAERIMRNLLDAEGRAMFDGGGTGSGTESSINTVPTPSSMSRYARHVYPSHAYQPSAAETSSSVADASLESMMRKVGLDIPNFGIGSATSRHPPPTSSYSSTSRPQSTTSASSSVQVPVASGTPETPGQPIYDLHRLQDDELALNRPGTDDSSDSLDDDLPNSTANPSEAFLVASQRASYDDSDSDSDSDSIDNMDDTEGLAPVHPFARALGPNDGDSFDDDSFDDPIYDNAPDVEEETLFGVSPAERIRIQAQAQARARPSEGNIRMLGDELLEDTIGIGTQMARAGRVEESPTPWAAVRPP